MLIILDFVQKKNKTPAKYRSFVLSHYIFMAQVSGGG